MLWWKLDWRSHLGERCQSSRQLARHIQNRTARSLVGSTARTCLWKNSVSHPTGPSCHNLSKHCGGHRGVFWLLWLSLRCPPAEPPGSNPNHSAFGCRRLRLPLPLTSRNCRCGHRLDKFGHHRAACSRVGVGKRGFPLECAAAQVCREAGGRVSTNVFVRALDLAAFNALDDRRVEVIADGLPVWHGAQLAIDTTLVSPLRGDGSARGRAADHSGSALQEARRRKERTYPELAGEAERARLVVLAAEVRRQPSSFVGWPRLARIPRQSEGGVVASLKLSARKQCGKSFPGDLPGAAQWGCAFDT